MSFYPEPDSHIKDKVKVVLDLSNYATKKELDHATGVDTSDLAAKKWCVKLKELSDAVANEVVKNKKYNTLKTKVNSFEKKIPDTTTLICINQYNIDKQNLEKKRCW